MVKQKTLNKIELLLRAMAKAKGIDTDQPNKDKQDKQQSQDQNK
jgi:hypothetical protein